MSALLAAEPLCERALLMKFATTIYNLVRAPTPSRLRLSQLAAAVLKRRMRHLDSTNDIQVLLLVRTILLIARYLLRLGNIKKTE